MIVEMFVIFVRVIDFTLVIIVMGSLINNIRNSKIALYL
jgi:hypothetical protein